MSNIVNEHSLPSKRLPLSQADISPPSQGKDAVVEHVAHEGIAYKEQLAEHDSLLSDNDNPAHGGTLRRSWSKVQYLIADTWLPELLSWTLSFLCLIAIVVLLWHYDGSSLPQFPHDITIGTLVALLTTISAASLATPVASGLSQLRWIRCADKPIKAIDLELYDQASRGAWGSLILLFYSRFESAATIGACLSILVLASNAITQQTIGYVTKSIVAPHGIAVVPNSTFFAPGAGFINQDVDIALQLPDDADSQTKTAFISGLLSANSSVPYINPHCSTGNCTWDVYKTLGICSSVVDVSAEMAVGIEEGQTNDTTPVHHLDAIQFPFGKTNYTVLRSTGHYYDPNPAVGSPWFYGDPVKSKRFGHLENSTAADFFVIWYYFNPNKTSLKPHAVEINLHFCVQTLKSQSTNGIPSTKQVAPPVTAFEFPRGAVPYRYGIDRVPEDSELKLVLTATPDNSSEKFIVSWSAQQAVLWYGRSLLNGTWLSGLFQGPYQTDETIGITAFEEIAKTWSEPKKGFELLATNLAMFLSNRIRSRWQPDGFYFTEADVEKYAPRPIGGTAYRDETIIRVSWEWLSLLVALILGSLLFLLLVMFMNRKRNTKIWRASTLALLQALDPSARPAKMNGVHSVYAMERRAQRVELRLEKYGEVWKLVG